MSARILVLAAFATFLSAAQSTAQSPPITPEQRLACEADVRSHCRTLMPGGGRLLACMSEKFASFSTPCREAILQSACAPQADPRLAGRFPCGDGPEDIKD